MPFGDPDVDAFDSSLVSVWKMDESSGTREDAVGSNDVTDINTVGSASGKNGNAADFVAANSEVLELGSGVTDQSGDFAHAMWFTSDLSAFSVVFAERNTSSNKVGLSIQWNAGTVTCFVNDGVEKNVTTSGLSLATFINLVVIVDGTTFYLFVDGVQKDTAALSGALTVSNNLRFACRNTGAGNEFFHDGLIDETAKWNGLSFGGGNPTRQNFVDGLFNGGDGLFFFPPTVNQQTIRRFSKPVDNSPVHHSFLE